MAPITQLRFLLKPNNAEQILLHYGYFPDVQKETERLLCLIENENARVLEALELTRDELAGAGLWSRDEPFMIQVDQVLYGPDTEREVL